MYTVILESGSKKAFASVLEWPGWSRSGRDEDSALQALLACAPRYARVATLAGLPFSIPGDLSAFQVVERLPGGAATDFGGFEAIPSADTQPASEEEARHLARLLRACQQVLDEAAQAAEGKRLRLGPRGGGRDLERMLEHVVGAQTGYLSRLARKVHFDQAVPPRERLAQVNREALEAIEAAARGGLPVKGPRGGKIWPLRYFVRCAAWHLIDHAWEIEDRVME